MLLILVSAAALLHTTLSSSTPLIPPAAPDAAPSPIASAAMAQNGVWALLPMGCEAPTSLDISTWAKCAQPLGFVDNEVAVLKHVAPGSGAKPGEFTSIARTHYAVAPGASATAPQVVQVDVPMIFSHTFLYLAVTPAAVANGRFEDAQAWPVACLAEADGGCSATTLAQVQTAAVPAPTDPERLYRLMRVSEPTSSGPATSSSSDTPTQPSAHPREGGDPVGPDTPSQLNAPSPPGSPPSRG